MAEEEKKQDAVKKETGKTETPAKPKPTGTDDAAAPAKKKKKTKKRSVQEARVCIQASYNNTIVTVTELNGNAIAWASSGSCGFKGTRKATPYASSVAAENAMNKAKLFGVEKVHIVIKGIGAGRDQALRAVNQSGVAIESITDTTAVPHNGCRARKARRV